MHGSARWVWEGAMGWARGGRSEGSSCGREARRREHGWGVLGVVRSGNLSGVHRVGDGRGK